MHIKVLYWFAHSYMQLNNHGDYINTLHFSSFTIEIIKKCKIYFQSLNFDAKLEVVLISNFDTIWFLNFKMNKYNSSNLTELNFLNVSNDVLS